MDPATRSTGPSRFPALILLLGSITAIGPMSIDMYLPSFPDLTESLGTNESMVQLTLTACLIGLGLGQLLIGPLSDAIGRRRPLVVGMVGYALASVGCALAPTVTVLAGARFVQGLAGAAGLVIAQALVRDMVEGPAVARVLSRLMLVIGVAPILAPVVGGQLLTLTGWRGLFWVLAGFGAVMTLVVATCVRETLPVGRRRLGGVADALGSYRTLVRDRRFVAYGLICGLGFASIFGYVSGSPFAYQEVHSVSPQLYGVLFGMNSVGMVVATQVNARLVLTVAPFAVLARAVPVAFLAGIALVLTTATGAFGVAGLAVPLFVLVSSLGLVLPNAQAMALDRHPESAGTAAALLGSAQFGVGAIAGPLVGVAGTETAVPMSLVITVGAAGMVAITALVAGRSEVLPGLAGRLRWGPGRHAEAPDVDLPRQPDDRADQQLGAADHEQPGAQGRRRLGEEQHAPDQEPDADKDVVQDAQGLVPAADHQLLVPEGQGQ